MFAQELSMRRWALLPFAPLLLRFDGEPMLFLELLPAVLPPLEDLPAFAL